jgi:hypothetical protein
LSDGKAVPDEIMQASPAARALYDRLIESLPELQRALLGLNVAQSEEQTRHATLELTHYFETYDPLMDRLEIMTGVRFEAAGTRALLTIAA